MVMKAFITCLSPIHIGSGRVLECFEYYFHDNKIIKFNLENSLKRLYEKYPDSIEKYSEWINSTTEKINNSKEEFEKIKRNPNNRFKDKNQWLSNLRKNFNIISFCENILKDKSLANQLLTDPQFHVQIIPSKTQPRRTMQLREMIHINHLSYIPGSSLKGAIRTALAFRAIKNLKDDDIKILLNGKKETDIIGIVKNIHEIKKLTNEAINSLNKKNNYATESILKNLSKERKDKINKIGSEVEKVIFGCGCKNKNANIIKYDDPKYDLLKVIKISDTFNHSQNLIAGQVISLTKDFKNKRFKIQPIQFCECIDSDSILNFDIEIDFSQSGLINKSGSNDWIDFEEKFKKLFNIDFDPSSNDLKEAVIKSIMDAIDEFSKAIIKKEKEWLPNIHSFEVNEILNFYDNLEKKSNLLRLGYSSGWHSTTIGLALAQNTQLKDYLSEIIYIFNLDLIQKSKNILTDKAAIQDHPDRILGLLKRNVKVIEFPVSRRMIELENNKYLPLGWIQVKIDN